MNRHKLAGIFKKVVYPHGEPYTFKEKTLFFTVGSRPLRRKYINSKTDTVRNDLLQIEYFEREFKPTDVLWDVGSHHGHYSIFAASLVKGDNQVFSFEPDADAMTVQQQNIRRNGFESKITLMNIAISGIDGQMMFSPQHGNANSHLVKSSSSEGSELIAVETATLNTLCGEIAKPTFVKIDTEGAEIDIMANASELLSDRSVTFVCELHPFAWRDMGVHYEDFLQSLEQFGRVPVPLDPLKSATDLPFYGTVLF